LREYFQENAHEDVWKSFEEAVEKLANAGSEVIEIPLPESFDIVHAAHRIIMACEAASVHEQNFRNRRLDYRINIRGLIASGLIVPSADYIRARRIRSRFIAEAAAMIKDVSCLLTPSALTPALRGLMSTGNPAFNAPWSFIGFPSITVPSDLTSDELPLGIQLVGKPRHEQELLLNAGWCERVLAF
jgi:aspartyl-tRNA(Asn)/glutamyl-tRNA(Gln) amidotransferase subunit A